MLSSRSCSWLPRKHLIGLEVAGSSSNQGPITPAAICTGDRPDWTSSEDTESSTLRNSDSLVAIVWLLSKGRLLCRLDLLFASRSITWESGWNEQNQNFQLSLFPFPRAATVRTEQGCQGSKGPGRAYLSDSMEGEQPTQGPISTVSRRGRGSRDRLSGRNTTNREPYACGRCI